MSTMQQGIRVALRLIILATILFNAFIPSPASARTLSASNQQTVNCPTSGDLVVATGQSCNLPAGSYTFNSVTVQSGGTLILQGNPSSNQGVTINTPTMTVDANSKVNADGVGYLGTGGTGGGPGGGYCAWATGGGAGYGGTGENGAGGGGIGYGSVMSPTDLGSAGGCGQFILGRAYGGNGGGSIKLQISDTLTVDGEISADGLVGGSRAGGGSGGSIWIDTNTLSGNGTIHADGSTGTDGGGDGAGGRIAVYSSSSAFSLDSQHVYARGAFASGNGGGPGTVYLRDKSNSTDKLVVDNAGNGVTTYAVHLPGTYSYNQIDISGNATLRISGSASRFTLNGNNVLAGDGTGRLAVEGTIITPQDMTIGNVSLTVLGNIEGAQNITLQSPGVLELYATSPLHSGIYTFSNITVNNGSTLRLVTSGNRDADYTNDPNLELNVTNLTVEAGGNLSADGTGYPGAKESGTGPGAGQSAWATGGGGGHGGPGQAASGAGGIIYDSPTYPILPGSSGGAGQDIYHDNLPGGAGGGAIRLIVSDTLNVNGAISADGVIGAGRSGGGSGGSIIIETTNLTGNGQVHANGGPQNGGGNGGGGRIAVYTKNSNNTITFTANGAAGYETAGQGTVSKDILHLVNSTVRINPPQVIADGSSTGTVTVTLKDENGSVMPGEPVQIAVATGAGLSINGQAVGPNTYVNIGNTDSNGIVTATLTTKQTGTRTIRARGGQETLMTTGTVEFVTASGPAVQDESVVSSSSSGNQCSDCVGCPVNNTQGNSGGPINTRTGGYDYTVTDLSFATTAGELNFVRSYASTATDLTSNLSPGWTHNQDMRLIFPSDPGGKPGVVLLKSRSANRYSFYINADGTYQAAAGIRATLVRNSGTPVRYMITDSNQNVYTFNESGKIITFANPQGQSWSYTYNSSGNLGKVSANNGASFLAFAYDTQGRIVTVTDHTGRNVSFSYDSAGDLVTATDVLGQTWSYSYDNAHRITQVTAPDQTIVERTEYDSQGRAVRQYDGEGNLVTELTFNADGTTTVADGLGNQQTHTYDARGTLVGKTDGVQATTITAYGYNFQPLKITNAAGYSLGMTWSADGVNLLSKTDPAGNTTQNTYDALNNLTSTTDPLGNTTSNTYAGKLLTSSTDASGGKTTYTYTPEGYLASVTDPAGLTTSYAYNTFGQRASMTDPNGNTWHYAYDALGRLTDTTDPRGRVAHTEYDATGQVVRSVQNYDPSRPQNDQNLYNIVTTYQYDARGKQIMVTDTYGRATQYVYDRAERLIKTIDAAGNATTNEYDAAGHLITVTDALGHKTTYTYDADGRLIKTIDALGNSSATTAFDISTNTSTVTNIAGAATTFYYDQLGRVIKVVDALGNTTLTTYDANGNVASRTDQLGHVTRYEYDALNRLVKTIDPNGGVTQTVYNDKGQKIGSIDPLGKQTTYTYDQFGRLVATTDPLGRTTRTEYDAYGRRVVTIDAAGNRTTYMYDLLDRVIATTDPLGNTTSTTYDALGNVLERTDANGHTTTYTYDPLNRVIITTDPNGNSATNAYDAAGNLISTTNALGEKTTYGYDPLNRQTSVSDPLGHTTQTYYDSLGRVSSVADANGSVTHFEFDVLGRQVAVVLNYKPALQPDAETNVRYEYGYDAVGSRISMKDPNGNVTKYTYDALNRLESKIDPLGNTWKYEYDAAGNQITVTDAKGQIMHYVYDDARQLTSIQYPDGTVSFAYTATGQRASMQDTLGTTTWAYDSLNRILETHDPFGNVVKYGYDAAGNRTSLTYPDGHVVNYSFDAANRLTDVSGPSGVSYSYDGAGRLSGITRANGVNTEYTYDDAGRLINLTHTTSQALVASYKYSYDPAGNLIQAQENVSKPAPPTATPTNTSTPTDTPTDTPTATPTPSPADLLAKLRASVENYSAGGQIDPTIENSLLSKIDAAISGFANGKINSTINQLNAFSNEVQAQRGKKISDSAADDLIAQVQVITSMLSAIDTPLPTDTLTPTDTSEPSPTITAADTETSTPEISSTPTLSPSNLLSALRTSVENYAANGQVDGKTADSLFGQLDAAEKGFADGKIDSTINQLGAFTNTVQAQRGKKITDAAADDLIAQAQVIIAILSATPTPELTLAPTLASTDTPSPTKTQKVKPPTSTPTDVPTLSPTITDTPLPTLTLTPSLTPTETLIPTDTFTPLPTATQIPPAGPLTINYTYDALHRLKKADYSDGRLFSYIYDANGNTLTASTESSSTSYTYDAANQLVTAQADVTVWHYVYDADGNLTEVLPNGNEANGAKRYTYNAAGYLVKVESHDASGWSTQSEIIYNGLGTRMTTSASGVTSQYASDGQLPLAISSGGKTTTILYGNGPVAEQMDQWNYVLTDGVNVPRQLTDMNGSITLSARYNPWGSPIETDGIGNLNASFIGNLLDMNTGLIYVGNGQYYDPATGRFLTRGVQPNSANPYVPWNPIGAIVAPLGLASVYFSRRKGKPRGIDRLILFLFLLLMFMNLACCNVGTSTQTTPPPEPSPTPTPSPTPAPAPSPVTPPSPTPGPTNPPPCNCNWLPDLHVITHYVTVQENDTFFTPNDSYCTPASDMHCVLPFETIPGQNDVTYQTPPVYHFYVGNASSGTCDANCVNWRVSFQGSGMLTESASLSMSGGKKYVQADTNNKPYAYGHQFDASYYFTDQITDACGKPLDANKNIIAVANNLFGSPDHSCGNTYYIKFNDPVLDNTVFTVEDRGTFTVENNALDHFDIYVGAQTHDSYYGSAYAKYDGQSFQVARSQP